MSESGREALPEVLELESSGGPPGSPGLVGRPSRMSRCGREALPDIRVWSGGPPGNWELSGGHPGRPGGIERPSRKSESGRGASRKSGRGLEALPNVR